MAGKFASTLFLTPQDFEIMAENFDNMQGFWIGYLTQSIEAGTSVSLTIEKFTPSSELDNMRAMVISQIEGVNYPSVFLYEMQNDHARILLNRFRIYPNGKNVFTEAKTHFVVIGRGITFNL